MLLNFIHSISGKELDIAIEILRAPYNIIVVMLFTVIAFYHASLGMRVVIEDYVPNLCARYFLIISIQIFSLVTVLSSILALLSLIIS